MSESFAEVATGSGWHVCELRGGTWTSAFDAPAICVHPLVVGRSATARSKPFSNQRGRPATSMPALSDGARPRAYGRSATLVMVGSRSQPRLNQCVVRMTSGVERDVAWRIVAKAHNATIAPVNVASAEALPPENAASPATSIAPPRTETSTM